MTTIKGNIMKNIYTVEYWTVDRSVEPNFARKFVAATSHRSHCAAWKQAAITLENLTKDEQIRIAQFGRVFATYTKGKG